MDELTILKNQVVIMKALMSLLINSSNSNPEELRTQIIFTEARIRGLQ